MYQAHIAQVKDTYGYYLSLNEEIYNQETAKLKVKIDLERLPI